MNDHSYANAVRETLKSCINSLGCMKALYLSNPEKDFTRTRKISFEDFINICLQMGNGSLQNELMKFYDFEGSAIPCKSAFCSGCFIYIPDDDPSCPVIFRIFQHTAAGVR